MADVLLSDMGKNEQGSVDKRIALRDKSWDRTLKMTVVGYNITDKGNIVLQAVKNNEMKFVTMFPEDGVSVDKKYLEGLINKLIYVTSHVDKTKDERGNVISEVYNSLYNGNNIKIISDFPNAFDNGEFVVVYPFEEALTVRTVQEIEIKGLKNPKTGKPVINKYLEVTMKDMIITENGHKMVMKNILVLSPNKHEVKEMIGKKVIFTETYKTKQNGKSYYVSLENPIEEKAKKVETPKPAEQK
jgi:hypothetical protein